MKPRVLDLFCGAGGCSVGYHRAGFDVTGVDIIDHPDYPFELIVADAMEIVHVRNFLDQFEVVHASPPCPRYSIATQAQNRDNHPDFVPPVLDALKAWGGTWIVENVEGAPLPEGVMFCGAAMGLRWIRRHRLFQSSAPIMSPGCACTGEGSVSVFGHSGEDRRKINGGVRKHLPLAEVRELMGVPWMRNRDDVSDAIPPAYTEYIGGQLIDYLMAAA